MFVFYTSKKEQLFNTGIISISYIPSDYTLKDKEKKFIDSYKIKSPIISAKEIKSELADLKYPLYFLDFETFGSAIPEFEGLHPYEQYPFQFSCHILDKDNKNIYLPDITQNKQKPPKYL